MKTLCTLRLVGTECILRNQTFKILSEHNSFKFSIRLLLQHDTQTNGVCQISECHFILRARRGCLFFSHCELKGTLKLLRVNSKQIGELATESRFFAMQSCMSSSDHIKPCGNSEIISLELLVLNLLLNKILLKI